MCHSCLPWYTHFIQSKQHMLWLQEYSRTSHQMHLTVLITYSFWPTTKTAGRKLCIFWLFIFVHQNRKYLYRSSRSGKLINPVIFNGTKVPGQTNELPLCPVTWTLAFHDQCQWPCLITGHLLFPQCSATLWRTGQLVPPNTQQVPLYDSMDQVYGVEWNTPWPIKLHHIVWECVCVCVCVCVCMCCLSFVCAYRFLLALSFIWFVYFTSLERSVSYPSKKQTHLFSSFFMNHIYVNRSITALSQGSVLGPSLFFLYANDLPQRTGSTCRLFSTDTACHNTTTDQDHLSLTLQ